MAKFYRFSFFLIIFFLISLPDAAPQDTQSSISIAANTTILEAFKKIEKETLFYFSYSSSDFDVHALIKEPLVNVTIETFMRRLFTGKAVKWSILGYAIKIEENKEQPAAAQPKVPVGEKLSQPVSSRKLYGQVINPQGIGIPGATVIVGNNVTVATATGYFSFKDIPENATLQVSSMGYEPGSVKIRAGQSSVRMILKTMPGELREIEVVSTGYQDVLRKRMVGAISTVDNKRFNEQAGTDVFTRLQYILSGLTVFPRHLKPTGNDLLIRGLSTFGGPTEPLIILDDFQYTGDLQSINPNDVESVSILKDAVASSIWGARAGNGVLLINTKKGRFGQPISVSVNTNVTITRKPDLFSLKMMSASDLIDVETRLFNDKFYDPKIPFPEHVSFTPAVSILLRERDGEITSPEAKTQLDRLRNRDVRNDFNRYFYQNAVNQQYSINVSQGTKDHAWLFSGGFDKNVNELKAIYERYTARFSNIYKLGKMDFMANVFYTQSDRKSGARSFLDYRQAELPIYTELIDQNGIQKPLYTFNNYREGFIDSLGGGKLLNWLYYPLEDYKHAIERTNIQQLNAEIGLKYWLTRELTLSAKYRYQTQKTENSLHRDLNSYYTRNLINSFSQIDYSRNTIKRIVPLGGILDIMNINQQSRDVRGQVDFNKTFGKHNITAMGGGQISEVVMKENSLRTYGFDEDIYSNAAVDFANLYPHFITGVEERIPGTSLLNKTNIRFVSVYANAAYTWKDQYSFFISGRKDATNTFGMKTNEKWKPLWSIGGSWLVINKQDMGSCLFPYLKLRLTYGKNGNVDPGKVAITTIRYLGENLALNAPYARIENYFDSELRWEQVSTLNAGLDFSINHNRLSGSFDIYRKRMTDLYGESLIDVTTGQGRDRATKNVGIMKGKGAELELSSINIKGKVEWRSHLLVNIQEDKIIKLKDNGKLDHSSIVGGMAVGREGYPAYAYFAYKSAGLDPVDGDPRGYINGVPSKDYTKILGSGTKLDDLEYMGRMLPKWSGSLGNSITWRNFTLNTRLTYKLGYVFRKETINYENLSYLLMGHSDFSKRWIKPGDEKFTTVPSMKFSIPDRDRFNMLNSDKVAKGDHIRLQAVDLRYQVSNPRLMRSAFGRIEVYTSLNNLGILWRANKDRIDPDNLNMRTSPSITIGANFNFSKKK